MNIYYTLTMFSGFTCFLCNFLHASSQTFQSEYFDRSNRFSFRKSAKKGQVRSGRLFNPSKIGEEKGVFLGLAGLLQGIF